MMHMFTVLQAFNSLYVSRKIIAVGTFHYPDDVSWISCRVSLLTYLFSIGHERSNLAMCNNVVVVSTVVV